MADSEKEKESEGRYGRRPQYTRGAFSRASRSGRGVYIPVGLAEEDAAKYFKLQKELNSLLPEPKKQTAKPKDRKRPGKPALAAEVSSLVQDVAGSKDAMREMAELRDEDLKEVERLKKELAEAEEDRAGFEARLVQIEEEVQEKHQKWSEKLECDFSGGDWEMRLSWLLLATTLTLCFLFFLAEVETFELLTCIGLFLVYCTYLLVENWLVRHYGCRAFFTKSVNHHYKFLAMYDHLHGDLRGDSYSQGEMKHTARYAKVLYTRFSNGWVTLSRPREMLVSLKLVTLAMTARNTDSRLAPKDVWDRMYATASSIHSVNFDASLVLKRTSGDNSKFCEIVTDSVDLAHALWMHNRERRLSHFRTTPA